MVAAASIPNTFQETLMPRNTADQGLITGISMSINYEIANAIAKIIEDFADELAGTKNAEVKDYRAHKRQRRFAISLNLFALGSSIMTQKLLKQKPDESPSRGIIRTGANWVSKTATASIIISILQQTFESVEKKSKKQRMITRIPIGLIGGAMTAVFIDHQRKSAIKKSNTHKLHDNQINTLEALGMGLGILGALGAVGYGQRTFADITANQMKKILPNSEDFWWTAGHLTAIVGTGLGIVMLMRRIYHHMEEIATKIEPAYLKKLSSTLVSGGKDSAVTWQSLSIQGRRYVSGAIAPNDIKRVMNSSIAIQPIRIFVGIDSAKTEHQRVNLAVQELERTGAFKRKIIMLISPTGTGYVNYVAVESAEYMSLGDIASVALQYSKRPSPMSLDRVPQGREQFKMLLKEISKRIETLPKHERPKLCIFGESLGAWTSQDCFINQGTDGLKFANVDKALWIGTPYGSKWKNQIFSKNRSDVEKDLVGSFDNIQELKKLPLSKQKKLRYVMLTHDNDGVALFGISLLYQKPNWLTNPFDRSPTISKQQYYTSPGTFLMTLMDMKNSMNVIPGKFEASGHDYRADLAEFISITYGFNINTKQMKKLEETLRANELKRATKLKLTK